ncbi:hypothetical protein JW960_10110 [candidate division KSB1 bacterium]|nr:hypothetical protein [candidate division KSB1 bacterium]
MMAENSKRFDGFLVFLILIYVLSSLGFIYYLYHGWDYYSTGFAERPRHEAYRLLKPGGNFGHGFGIVGSAMMLVMLLYSLRKRTPVCLQKSERWCTGWIFIFTLVFLDRH